MVVASDVVGATGEVVVVEIEIGAEVVSAGEADVHADINTNNPIATFRIGRA